MRLEQDRLQIIKNYLHAVQAGFLFLSIILTIAVYTRNGASDGRTGWFFGLSWLTIPVLVYLVMVPMWSRTQRFANVYAFVILDGLFTILWLSACAAVASYISAGGGCSKFSLGSNGKCKLSEGTVVLGVFIMVLFVGTTYISLRNTVHYRRTGTMPSTQKANDFESQTVDAFSSNMQKDDFEDEEDTISHRESFPTYDQAQAPFDPISHTQSEQYAPLTHQYDHEALGQPQPVGLGLEYSNPAVGGYDTSYAGAYGDRRLP